MERVVNQAISSPEQFSKLLLNLQARNDLMVQFLQLITRQRFNFTDYQVQQLILVQFNDETRKQALIYFSSLMNQNAYRFLELLLSALLYTGVNESTGDYFLQVFSYLHANYANFAGIMKKVVQNHFIAIYNYSLTQQLQQIASLQSHYQFLFLLAARFQGFQVEILDQSVKLLLQLDLVQSKNLQQFYGGNIDEQAICSSLKACSLQNIQIQQDDRSPSPYDLRASQTIQDPELLRYNIDILMHCVYCYLADRPAEFTCQTFLPIFINKQLPTLCLAPNSRSQFIVLPMLKSDDFRNQLISELFKVAFASPNVGISVAISGCDYLSSIVLHDNCIELQTAFQVVQVLADISVELSEGLTGGSQFSQLKPAFQRAVIASQSLLLILLRMWQQLQLGQFETLIVQFLQRQLFYYCGQLGRQFWELIAEIQCYDDDIEQSMLIQVGKCREKEVIADIFLEYNGTLFSRELEGIWRKFE